MVMVTSTACHLDTVPEDTATSTLEDSVGLAQDVLHLRQGHAGLNFFKIFLDILKLLQAPD